MNNLIETTEYLTMSDQEKIALHSWIPQGKIQVVVQISHGMIEYAKRYNHFAKFLCQHGIAVYAHDHRGHGETAINPESFGFLSEKEGFQQVIKDLREVIIYLKSLHPEQKIILFGHSFGSFISQGYIEQYGNEINGCILSGTAGPRPLLVRVAIVIAFIIKRIRGSWFRSELMNTLAFGNYNYRIPNAQSKNAWLTRDEKAMIKYDFDPYCTFIPTIGFFYDLFSGLIQIHRKEAIFSIPKNLPVFLFAGTDDPVGSYGKTVKKLYEIYQSVGIHNLSLKLYPNGRHEMLNEVNSEEVMSDVLTFILKQVNNRSSK